MNNRTSKAAMTITRMKKSTWRPGVWATANGAPVRTVGPCRLVDILQPTWNLPSILCRSNCPRNAQSTVCGVPSA